MAVAAADVAGAEDADAAAAAGGSHGENRVHTNGGTERGARRKKQSLSRKLFGWLSGKKAKPETKQPFRSSTSPSRPEFKERSPVLNGPSAPNGRERVPVARTGPRRPKRSPQEIVSPKLYVGNLAYEAAESDLFDLFSKVGAVKNVEIAMDRHSNRSKGFGFVEMESLETAKEAAAKLNRTDFMGRQIVVSGAKVDKRPTQAARDEDTTSQSEPQSETGSNPDATI